MGVGSFKGPHFGRLLASAPQMASRKDSESLNKWLKVILIVCLYIQYVLKRVTLICDAVATSWPTWTRNAWSFRLRPVKL